MRFGKGTKTQQRREVGLRRKREEEEKKELCECTTRQRHRDRQTHSLSQSLHQRRLGKFPGREGKGGRESGPGEGGRAARQLLTSYVRMLGKWQQTDVSSSFALIQDPPPSLFAMDFGLSLSSLPCPSLPVQALLFLPKTRVMLVRRVSASSSSSCCCCLFTLLGWWTHGGQRWNPTST